ncbi:unnamed protein product [Mytilus coruscus]|uniref:Uncharacterized protein n=1 Tax=Mytilus coruscus TaxID=42192 RepID=A0A6J8D574_MYTCO|nr:unnamed protein product [Mytilus coruscus]
MHDEPCCDRCYKRTHNRCVDVLSLKSIHNVKSSAAFGELEDEIENLICNISSTEENKRSFLNNLLKEKMEVLEEIEKNRAIWNENLDLMQMKLESELAKIYNAMKEEVSGELHEIKYLKHLVDISQKTKDQIKTNSNDVKCFLTMKSLSKEIQQAHSELESLSSMSSLHEVNLNFLPNNDILNELVSLGTISLDEERKPMSIERFHLKQAQTISDQNEQIFSKASSSNYSTYLHRPRKERRAINLHTKSEPFNTKTESPSTACDENIFMDRDNRRLILYDENGRFNGCINLTVKPDAVHIVSEEEIQVIHGNPPKKLTLHLGESKSSNFAISSRFQACIIIAVFLSLVLYISLCYKNSVNIFNQLGRFLTIFIVCSLLVLCCRFLFDGMSQTASRVFRGKVKTHASPHSVIDTSQQWKIARQSNLYAEFQNSGYWQ